MARIITEKAKEQKTEKPKMGRAKIQEMGKKE
jgi:hypothetical protein